MKYLSLLFPIFMFAQSLIFSASWQRGFCEVKHTKECRYTKNYNYFTIHGLWPKKQHCGYAKLHLPKELWKTLKTYMPSTWLIKHEWKKHGTCYSKDAIIYFSDAIKLIETINNSKIKQFFVDNEGKIITKQKLNRVINSIYPHSARKVQMICKNGYVTELRFSLNGNVYKDSFYEMLKRGKNLIGGCQKGRIK